MSYVLVNSSCWYGDMDGKIIGFCVMPEDAWEAERFAAEAYFKYADEMWYTENCPENQGVMFRSWSEWLDCFVVIPLLEDEEAYRIIRLFGTDYWGHLPLVVSEYGTAEEIHRNNAGGPSDAEQLEALCEQEIERIERDPIIFEPGGIERRHLTALVEMLSATPRTPCEEKLLAAYRRKLEMKP